MSRILRNKVAIVFFLILGTFYTSIYRREWTQWPNGIHAWAQADHLALAKGFTDNGLDFFHPQTQLYNQQFPDAWLKNDDSRVTAVDFPLHQYLAGTMMSISGTPAPVIYRVYMFLLGITGLVFLYRTVRLLNGSELAAMTVVAFIGLSPVFTFYQIRFLPSVPSLSTFMIGWYHYVLYRKEHRWRSLVWAVALLTVSAMTRTTFVIPLLAVYGVELIRLLRYKERRIKKLMLAMCSLFVIAGWMFYAALLRKEYGALFLNELLPAYNWEHFKEIVQYVWRTWQLDYLTEYHYLLLIILPVLVIVPVWKKKEERLILELVGIGGLLLIGAIAFFVAMARQFSAHDYYFMDSFFPGFVVLLSVIASRYSPKKRIVRYTIGSVVVLIIAGMSFKDILRQDYRTDVELLGANNGIVKNYEESTGFLEGHGVGKNERLLVLTPAPPNLPFLIMDRSGYMNMYWDRDRLRTAMNFPANYVVFENESFTGKIYAVYPEIIRELEVVATNGKITLCRKKINDTPSLEAFLLSGVQPEVWKIKAVSGNTEGDFERIGEADGSSWKFSGEQDTGPVVKLRKAGLLKEPRMLYCEALVEWDEKQHLQMVASLVEDGEVRMYKTFDLAASSIKESNTRHFSCLLPVPAVSGKQAELAVYIFNPEKTTYSVHRFECRLH